MKGRGRGGGSTSKPHLSFIHSYLGKEGFTLSGWERRMEGGWGAEMRRGGRVRKTNEGREVWGDNWGGGKDKNRSRGEKGEDLSRTRKRTEAQQNALKWR